jgi:hypothetical protein
MDSMALIEEEGCPPLTCGEAGFPRCISGRMVRSESSLCASREGSSVARYVKSALCRRTLLKKPILSTGKQHDQASLEASASVAEAVEYRQSDFQPEIRRFKSRLILHF